MAGSQPQSIDVIEGVLPGSLSGSAGWQRKAGTVLHATQLGGHQEHLVPQGLKRRGLELWRQAQAFEPVDEVVGEQEEMEVKLVGEEVAGWDAAQGVVSLELPNEQFNACPIVVEAPEVERLQRQVRDEHLVAIAAELEEGQLRRRLVGIRPADHHETIQV